MKLKPGEWPSHIERCARCKCLPGTRRYKSKGLCERCYYGHTPATLKPHTDAPQITINPRAKMNPKDWIGKRDDRGVVVESISTSGQLWGREPWDGGATVSVDPRRVQ